MPTLTPVNFDPFGGEPTARITVTPNDRYANAVSSIESGGNYQAIGPDTRDGDRAFGRYQIMGKNIGPWTEEALGRRLSPEEFLRDPAAQDAVFQKRFGDYVAKYGPEGAARAWFAGEGGMNDPNRKDVLGTSVADYAAKFNAASGSQQPASQPKLVPVDHDPFASDENGTPTNRPRLVPVDHDPFASAPTPQEPSSTLGSVLGQVPTGFNSAVATIAGAPLDLARGAVNLGIRGVNAALGTEIPENKDEFGGSASIKRGMGMIGINPDDTPASTTEEKIARGLGEGGGMVMLPQAVVASLLRSGALAAYPRVAEAVGQMFGKGESAAGALTDTAVGAAAGGSGAAAAEAAPEPYKPLAEVAGALGGGLAAVGTAGAMSAAGKSARLARDYAAPLTKGGRERMAAETLAERATSPEASLDALRSGGADELVPGSKPTTFQATGDMGLGSLEREVSTRNPVEFNVRRAEQNEARVSAIEGLQPSGSPADLSAFLQKQLRTIDDETDAAVRAATGKAQAETAKIGGDRPPEVYGSQLRSAVDPARDAAVGAARREVEGLGGQGSPDEFGGAMRHSLADARRAAKERERALWEAVDPDNSLVLRVGTLRREAADLAASVSPSARPAQGEEAAIFEAIRRWRPAMPFREVTDLRGRVSAAMREELRTAGETPAYGRLSRLRGMIERAINGAVERRAAEEAEAVARGEMVADDTFAANLGRQIEAWQRDRAQAARENLAATFGGYSASRATSASRPSRAVEPLGGEPRGPSGNQSVSEPPSREFDDAARERLTAATTATRERAETYDRGPVGTVLRSGGTQGSYRSLDASVPDAIFKSGPGGYETMRAYQRAVGDNPEAIRTLNEAVTNSLRRAAQREDGTLDPAAFVRWRDGHRDALRALPNELRARFNIAARASQALEEFRPVRPEIPDARLPGQFVRSGPGAAEDIASVRRLAGPSGAAQVDDALAGYAASLVRNVAVRPDGTLDPAKFATWRKQHADALRAFPDLDRQFATAADASRAVEQAVAARTSALDAYQSDAIGRLLGVQNPQDVTRTVAGIFGRRDGVAQMKQLAAEAEKNHAAKAGLRKAVVDHIMARLVGNTEAATSGESLIKSDALQSFVRQNRETIAQVFKPDEVRSMLAVAADIRRGNRSIAAVKLPGGSNTAQDQIEQNATMLRRLLHYSAGSSAGGGAGFAFGGPIGGIAGTIGGAVITAMRESGLKQVDDIVKRALLDPEFARILLMRASSKPDRGPARRLAQYLNRSNSAALLGAGMEDGGPSRPVNVSNGGDMKVAETRVTADPSDGQREAGNYRKGHVRWNGLDISIETPAGGVRRGTDPATGKPWEVKMPVAYGYIKRTSGRDGDQIDAFLGPDPGARQAFVVNQIDPRTKQFDEHKLLLGFPNAASAARAYDASFSNRSGPSRRNGQPIAVPVEALKEWLSKGDARKPFKTSMLGQAEEAPSAEPLSDIAAQVRDMRDPDNQRGAVWIAADGARHLRSIGALREVAVSGVPLVNFDGHGGVLVAKDPETAQRALAMRRNGVEMQKIIGSLTGDGERKPDGATDVVQQIDDLGNVTRERLIEPSELASTLSQFRKSGRYVRVADVADALARRKVAVEAEGVAK